jgi:hypothetical protein
MIKQRLIGLAAAIPLLLAATPAHAQTAAGGNCQYQFGFATVAGLIPNVIGSCVIDQKSSNLQGDTMQETSNGLLTWTKATNVVEFTNGQRTWVYSGYGLILRDGTTRYDWEGTTSLVAGIAINSKGQVIDTQTGQVIPTDARIKVG